VRFGLRLCSLLSTASGGRLADGAGKGNGRRSVRRIWLARAGDIGGDLARIIGAGDFSLSEERFQKRTSIRLGDAANVGASSKCCIALSEEPFKGGAYADIWDRAVDLRVRVEGQVL